jgi:hypothetical protein
MGIILLLVSLILIKINSEMNIFLNLSRFVQQGYPFASNIFIFIHDVFELFFKQTKI